VFCTACNKRIGKKIIGFEEAKKQLREHKRFHLKKKTNYMCISILDWIPPSKMPGYRRKLLQ